MKIIVSLTTTSARLNILKYTIQSILSQTIKADELVINVSKNGYLNDSGIKDLPKWMEARVFSIRYVDNTGPYRKLIPLINEIGDLDVIITADDDVIYAENWIERLLELSKDNPENIICGMARGMKKNIFGGYKNYSQWGIEIHKKKSREILPIGCAGILYRKNLLDLSMLNDPIYKKLSKTTDDLWFKACSYKKGVEIYVDPEIGFRNAYVQDGVGLGMVNIQDVEVNQAVNSFKKIMKKIMRIIFDYFGVFGSANDKSWNLIRNYANIKRLK